MRREVLIALFFLVVYTAVVCFLARWVSPDIEIRYKLVQAKVVDFGRGPNWIPNRGLRFECPRCGYRREEKLDNWTDAQIDSLFLANVLVPDSIKRARGTR